ncbi:MAG: hypothetical protein KC731_10950, partial [Myxococcales bacterium]|nr:hypothetical protein [Myxococcales bacterium]
MASSKTRPDSSLDSDPAPASEEGATRASDAFGPTLQASSIAPGPLSHPLGQEAVTEEQLGRYEVEGELGVGGIGRVNLAYDKHLGRRVALKELHEEQVPRSLGPGLKTVRTPVELRFVNEARITGQLEHPGVVPVYELGRRADGTLYYTMRNVRGRTFEDALATNLRGRLRLLPHFVDLCNTVAYAHSRGVIHRDLK